MSSGRLCRRSSEDLLGELALVVLEGRLDFGDPGGIDTQACWC